MPTSEEGKLEQLKKQLDICDYLLKHELDLSDADLAAIADSTEIHAVLRQQLDAEHQLALQQSQTSKLGRLAISLTAALPLGALVPGLLFSLGVAISLPLHIGLMASFFLLGMGLKLHGLNKEQEDFTRKYQLMAVKRRLLTNYNQELAGKNITALQHLIVDEQGIKLITADGVDDILREGKQLKAAIERLTKEKTLSKHSAELLNNIPDQPKATLRPAEKKFWRDPKLWIKRLFINSLALAATVFGGYIALFKFGYVATALAVFTGAALPYVLAGIGAGITLALLAAIVYGAYKKHVSQQQLARLDHEIESAQNFNTYYHDVSVQLIKAESLQLQQQLEQTKLPSDIAVDVVKQEPADRFKASADALIHTLEPDGKIKQPFKEKVLPKTAHEQQEEQESEGEGEAVPVEEAEQKRTNH